MGAPVAARPRPAGPIGTADVRVVLESNMCSPQLGDSDWTWPQTLPLVGLSSPPPAASTRQGVAFPVSPAWHDVVACPKSASNLARAAADAASFGSLFLADDTQIDREVS